MTGSELRGFGDGFEMYGATDGEELKKVLTDGVVALDTNFLLYLYNCGSAAREQIFGVLDAVMPSLFLPAQVQAEFWRNRDDVIRNAVNTNSLAGLREAKSRAISGVRAWQQRTMLTAEAEALEAEIEALFRKLLSHVRSDRGGRPLDLRAALRSIDDDPIIEKLRSLFEGRVGLPYSSEVFAEMVQRGRARFGRRIPPGYMDSDKQGQEEEGVGDYLVWEQLIDRAVKIKKPVLFVTDDKKEDWWRLDSENEPIGPRVELVEEMAQRGGVELFMLQRSEFLAYASEFLNVPVDESTIDAAVTDADDAPSAASTSWTSRNLAVLLARLVDVGATPQEAVLRVGSSAPDGFVPRDKVYEVTGFSPSRSLVGFRKPAVTAMRYLQSTGELPEGLPLPLRARYQRPGKTDGYEVPQSIIDAAAGISDDVAESPVTGEASGEAS
jgi:hypothetical protein